MTFLGFWKYVASYVLCVAVEIYMAVFAWNNRHPRLYYTVAVVIWLGLVIGWVVFGVVSPLVAICLVPIVIFTMWLLSLPYIAVMTIIRS